MLPDAYIYKEEKSMLKKIQSRICICIYHFAFQLLLALVLAVSTVSFAQDPYLITDGDVSPRFIVPCPKDYFTLSISAQSKVLAGEYFMPFYRIHNPRNTTVSITLGCSIRLDLSSNPISDPLNDKVVTIGPNKTEEFFRLFKIPVGTKESEWDPRSYAVTLAIWPSPTDFSGSPYDTVTWDSLIEVIEGNRSFPQMYRENVLSGNNRTALILVHGQHNESAAADKDRWIDFIQWYMNSATLKQHFDLYRFSYDSAFNEPHEAAEGLLDLFENWSIPGSGMTLKQKYTNQRVVLLAHSYGGLVCRAAMNQRLSDNSFFGDRVYRLVTLATPHHGSPFAVPLWLRYEMDNISPLYPDELALWTVAVDSFAGDPGQFALSWDNFDQQVPFDVKYPSADLLEETRKTFGPLDTWFVQSVRNPYLTHHTLSGFIDKIIAIGGYNYERDVIPKSDVPRITHSNARADDPTEHILLGVATYIMKRIGDSGEPYALNDGLVPLSSALFQDAKEIHGKEPMRINVNAKWGLVDIDHKTFLDDKRNETGASSGFFEGLTEMLDTVGDEIESTDNEAPKPNPMTWMIPPVAIDSHTISMQANTATDPSGVEYCFQETSGNPGGDDSDWQAGSTYTDDGLLPGTIYRYRVSCRDKSPKRNLTDYSSEMSATTPELQENDLFAVDIVLQTSQEYDYGGSTVVSNPQSGQSLYPHFYFDYTGSNILASVSIKVELDGHEYFTYEFSNLSANQWVAWSETPWEVKAGPHELRGVVDYNNSIYEDNESNNSVIRNYMVPGPYVHVTSPDGGETLQRGGEYIITWDSDSEYDPIVTIELRRGTGSNMNIIVIEEEVENVGNYLWMLPSDIPLADDYRVFVMLSHDSSAWDYSDGVFAILPAANQLPLVADIADHNTTEGILYTGPTPSLTQGTAPITWSLVEGPVGMTINPNTGIVSWPNPPPDGNPYTVTIRATNSEGYDDETWQMTVVERVAGYIVLDGFGGFHAVGSAPDLLNKESFYPGFDIVRDFEILPDKTGVVALDGYGGSVVLPFPGQAPKLKGSLQEIDQTIQPPFTPGTDQYQALVAKADSKGYWVLDESGRIYGVGSALPEGASEALLYNMDFDLTPDTKGAGVDGAVDFVVLQDEEDVQAIIVLKSYGDQIVVAGDPTGIGVEVNGGKVTGPGPATGSWNVDAPYFGWDIAREIDLEPTGKGYMVLDGFGGIHPVGDARTAWNSFIPGPRPGMPPEAGGHTYFGWDIAEKIAYTPDGLGLVMLDGFGGTHYDGNIVPITEIYFGFDIARDIEIFNVPAETQF